MKIRRYYEARDYVYKPLVTGIGFIDAFSGFGSDDFCVIGGGTGSGKTYLAMFMAFHAAQAGARVLFLNCEMFAHKFVARMQSMGFDFERDFGQPNSRGHNRLMVMHQEDFKGDIGFKDIEAWVGLLKPDLLVLDLFSCIIPEDYRKLDLTQEYAVEFSFFPKRFGCAVITTEQLSKDAVHGRPDENNICGGKALTRKASKVITLFNYYRAYPEKKARETIEEVDRTIEVIVKKERGERIQEGIHLLYKDKGFRNLTGDERTVYMDNVFGDKKDERRF